MTPRDLARVALVELLAEHDVSVVLDVLEEAVSRVATEGDDADVQDAWRRTGASLREATRFSGWAELQTLGDEAVHAALQELA